MRLKKALALTLTAAMAIGTLAGCGSSSGTAETTVKETTQAAATESTASAETESTAAKSLADYDKVDTFNAYMMGAGITDEEFNNLEQAKLFEEKTGYKVNYTQIPDTDTQTAIQNAFMLKEDFQYMLVSKDTFFMLLAAGALAPITEYVEGSEYLKDQISEVGWDLVTKDGEIYGVPQRAAKNCAALGLAYRADWLKDYNEANPEDQIDAPSEENGYSMCVSDFRKMLEYFNTRVAKGGHALGIGNGVTCMTEILPAFGVYQKWMETDGTVQFMTEQPGFEEYAEYMTGLYDDGLVYYQATSNDTGVIAAFQSEMAGVVEAAHWEAYTLETVSAPEGEDLSQYTDDNIGYISALVPDDNKGDASAVRVWSGQGYNSICVLPSYNTAEQSAAVVDWMDKKLEPELYRESVIGVEGETYTVENGEYYPILPEFNDRMGYADKLISGNREEDNSKYWLARTRKTAAQDKLFSTINYNVDNTGIKNSVDMMSTNDAYDNYFSKANTDVSDQLVLMLFNSAEAFDLQKVHDIWVADNGDDITNSITEWYNSWGSKDIYNEVKAR